jgi:regulator of RNase E activity RraA
LRFRDNFGGDAVQPLGGGSMADTTEPVTHLPAAAVADASVRLGRPIRVVPDLRRLVPGRPLTGRARPVRHAGSVDVFFEALELAAPGEILVIDDGGRRDEGCIGDLAGLEIRDAGIAGVVVWGLHRDSRELVEIGLPIWSLGTNPVGPAGPREREADALERALVGDVVVEPGDVVVADDDGVLFVPAADWAELAPAAALIVSVERRQADLARSGQRLRDQYDFAGYLARRADQPGYTFRDHLRTRGAAIEE